MSFISQPLPRPWFDRAGRFSAFKLACFIIVLMPAAYLLWLTLNHNLGERPIDYALLQTGNWVVRFLTLTLAITPLRRVSQWNRLLIVRRMLGLATLGYAVLHFSLYGLQQNFDLVHITSEIVFRFYLTIGFLALLGLVALGVTSTDNSIKRLGAKKWNRLHSIVYGIAVLGLVHFVLQSKQDVSQAFIFAGIFVLLMGARRIDKKGNASVWVLLGLAIASALVTMMGEAFWYHLHGGVPLMRILSANIIWAIFPRPVHWVLAAGLLLAGLRFFRPPPQRGRASTKEQISQKQSATA